MTDEVDFWDESSLELADGGDQLGRRIELGRQAIELGDDNDPETDASDVISDMLTALYGPEGWHDEEGRYHPNGDAHQQAMGLLDRALRSYEGDAEDYTKDDA